MSKKTKGGYYAVHKGRNVGVYRTWEECEAQIKGFPGARYKKFTTESEARLFAWPGLIEVGPAAAAPTASTSTQPSTATESTTDSKGKKRAFGPEVSNPSEYNIVYSDGACKGNGKPGSVAGVGVWWGPNDPRNIFERCPGDQTNNRAELIAILRVLETVPPDDKKPLLIRTDSQYSIQCYRDWIHAWRRKGWKNSAGAPVKNVGIIKCTSVQFDIHGALGHKVVLEYVKGHSGDEGNDGADLMANRGATLSAAADRDWDALEAELQERLRQIGSSRKSVPFEVKASEDLSGVAPETEEPAAKVRKLDPPVQKEVKPSPAAAPVPTPTPATPSKGKQPAVPTIQASSSSKTPTKTPSKSQPSVLVSASAFAAKTQPSPSKSSQQPQQRLQVTSPTSSQKSSGSAYDHIWNEGNKKPLQAIFLAPAMVASVDAKDVNFDDYADCLLDPADLANELSD